MAKDRRYPKLKYWRDRLQIKQEDFAVLLGCSASNYSHKESGHVKFSLSDAILITDVINKQLAKTGQPRIKIDDIFLD